MHQQQADQNQAQAQKSSRNEESEELTLSSEYERAELCGTLLDGRYLIGKVLGLGGTGIVFSATRIDDSKEVVVKTLRKKFVDHPDLGRRLRREAEVSRRVGHPGIVSVLDEGTLNDGSPYVVIERIHGECLHSILRRTGKLSPHLASAIVMRVASTLHSAHVRGYVHRDIKPEHIVLDYEEDGSIRVRVLDFGVCASGTAPRDERDREVGRVYGTPSYVSPEQAAGDPDVDARADVFGLGVVLFEAVTGRLPFTATNVANLLRAILRDDAPRAGLLRQDLSFEIDEVIARAMGREREVRFPSMRAFQRALAPLVKQRSAVDQELRSLLVTRTSPSGIFGTATHVAA